MFLDGNSVKPHVQLCEANTSSDGACNLGNLSWLYIKRCFRIDIIPILKQRLISLDKTFLKIQCVLH